MKVEILNIVFVFIYYLKRELGLLLLLLLFLILLVFFFVWLEICFLCNFCVVFRIIW